MTHITVFEPSLSKEIVKLGLILFLRQKADAFIFATYHL